MPPYCINEFQHEKDSSIATSILNNAVTKPILDKLESTGLEKVYTYLYESSCPQLTEKNSPKLFDTLNKACEMFGLKLRPKIFITRDYREMVYLRGVDKPFIIFSSEYLKKIEELNDETLLGVLAGQVAGIRCQHHTLLYITWGLEFASSYLPGGSMIIAPFINEWKRNRFFTYDRAFALATNNRTLSLRQVFINAVPKNIIDKMNLETKNDVFIEQANHFIEEMDRMKDVVSIFSEKNWLPERYIELKNFFDERRQLK